MRIRAVAALGDEVLAVAVGRHLVTDFGPSHLVARHSADGGRTWTGERVLHRGWGRTVDNPTLIADPATGSVHLLFQTGYRRLWHRISADGGRSFGPARDVTAAARDVRGVGFRARGRAPGPGTGAVLASGRLVVPVWVSTRPGRGRSAVATIVSDDAGRSWHPGAPIAPGRYAGTSEAVVAPLPDGGALLSFRQRAVPHRLLTRSPDGASGWSAPVPATELREPVCQAGLSASAERLAFANPDAAERATLTVHWSADAGRSWGSPVRYTRVHPPSTSGA